MTPLRRGGARAALLLAAVLLVAPASVAAAPPDRVPGELIVRYEPGVPGAQKADLREASDVRIEEPMLLERAQLLEVKGDQTVGRAVRRLNRDPAVEYAEPNWLYQPEFTPDDTRFDEQWGLHNTGQLVSGFPGTADADIDAPEAWDTHTGNVNFQVAIVDTGVQVDHPDLEDRIWQNNGETGGGKESNGVDDDSNSFGSRNLIDDYQGWDFFDDDNDPSPGTENKADHGTHVAGIAGAEGNNDLGVTGVNFNGKLMALRGGSGSGLPNSDTSDAFVYAIQEGAEVINGSFGAQNPSGSFTHEAIISANPGHLFVFSAGNDGDDNDATAHFPSDFAASYSNVIAVASTTQTDARSSFSNYGETNVDLGAPGSNILSTVTNDGYDFKQGTSMASPMVAGAAALVKAANPTATAAELAEYLRDGVDLVPALDGRTISGGRLNVDSSMALPTDTTSPAVFNLISPSFNSFINDTTPLLDWQDSSDAGSGLREYELLMRQGTSGPYTLNRDEIPPATSEAEPAAPLQNGQTYDWYVRARDKADNTIASGFFRFTVDTTLPTPFDYVSPADNFITQGLGFQTFDWTASSDANLDEYELLIDGVVVIDDISPGTTADSVDLSGSTEGQHNWSVRAKDKAGNTRTITGGPRFFRIDRTPPTVPFRSFPSDGAWVNTDTPEFFWQASTDFGGSGVDKYILSLGGPANQIKEVGPNTTNAHFDNPIPDGDHPWSVIVHDKAGNVNFTPGGRTVRVDTIAPDAFTLDAPPDAALFTDPADPQFSWNPSADAGSGLAEYELIVDGAVSRDAIDPGTNAATAGAPPPVGDHTWNVRARDLAGNTTTATQRGFTVEAAQQPPPPPPPVEDPPPVNDSPPIDGEEAPPDENQDAQDRVAPEILGKVALDPKRFAVGKGETPVELAARRKPAPRGTMISYELSEPSQVSLAIELRRPGLQLENEDGESECVRASKKNRRLVIAQIVERLGEKADGPKGKKRIRRALRKAGCPFFKRRGKLERAGEQGQNEVPFSGRIGKRKLANGRYRLLVEATDAAGNASEQSKVRFRIVSAGRKR